MLDFYYAERLSGRFLSVPQRSIEERLDRIELPAGYLALRRLAELLLVIATLPITLPLCALTAIGVAIDSPGPILFQQERKGLGGARFKVLKLRSMRSVSAGEEPTVPGDARVTRFGRFIRRHHLDELPQLWNVLVGEMSLIGPRPEPAPLSERYEAAFPLYHYRFLVRPGLTGWAQVEHGHTSDLESIRTKLDHDLHYILHLSPRLDLLIALRTIRAVATGHGAR